MTPSQTQTPTPSNTQTPTPTQTQTPTAAPASICLIGSNVGQFTIERADNNQFYIGGDFSYPQSKMAKFYEDGSQNTGFAVGTSFNDYVTAILPMGTQVLVGGNQITSYNGTSRGCIYKLNSNGTVDTAFSAGTLGDVYTSKSINQMLEMPDGKIVAVGDFADYAGNLADNAMLLNADGSFVRELDIFSSYNRTAALQSDNQIVIGGLSKISRITSGGTRDTAFENNHPISGYLSGSTNPYADVWMIKIQSDGKIVCVGGFVTVNGVTKNGIVRLNTDGTIDSGFSTGSGFNARASDVIIESNGKIVVVGLFTTYDGSSSSGIVRLNSDGTRDTSFNVGTGFNADAVGVTQIRDYYYVTGEFTLYNGLGTTINSTYPKMAALTSTGEVAYCPLLTPTPTPTLTPTPTQSKTEVYFNMCASSSADGNGDIQVTVRAVDVSGTSINVDTNVIISFSWEGDLFSVITGTVTISSGSDCNSGTFGGADIGENISIFDFNNTPSPASSATQNYNNDTAESGTCILGC